MITKIVADHKYYEKEQDIAFNFCIFFQILQVIPELYIQYQLLTLFLYFKDLKAQNMFRKSQDWTYFHTFIFVSVLATIIFQLTRTLYDDIILPIFIEKGEFDTNIERKLSVARKIQIIICDLTDMMTGTALLYVCYNNTKFALKKKQRQHRRFMRYQKKMHNDQMGENLTTQQDGSEASRPNYGTATINSILMNQTSPTNNTDQTKPQVIQNGKPLNLMANSNNHDSTTNDFNTDNGGLMKQGQQQHLSFQFNNGSSNYNKNRQTQNIFNKQERQYLSNSDGDDSDDSDYYEEEDPINQTENNEGSFHQNPRQHLKYQKLLDSETQQFEYFLKSLRTFKGSQNNLVSKKNSQFSKSNAYSNNIPTDGAGSSIN
eukprot:403348763